MIRINECCLWKGSVIGFAYHIFHREEVLELKGKKALVTGGAIRMGKAICESLAAAGCHIAIQYRESQSDANKLVEALSARGVQATALQADLNDMQQVGALVAEAQQRLGGLDILVNNAAVFHKTTLLASDPDVVQAELGVNALAPIELMRVFGRLHESEHTDSWPEAAIVNILDRRIAGVEKGAFPYALSKNMLRDATQMAARELGPAVHVNGVAPGPILPPPGKGEDYLSERAGPMVLALRPAPRDVAKAVLFLLQADGITGQVIYVDSGQHLL